MHPASGSPVFSSGALLGDRYRLERRIAAGGMATVWLARDEELQREVAVKVLSEVLLEDPSYLLRFRREARLAAGLAHPSLVRIYDFSGEAERPYLVMEYVGGGTLADRIAAAQPRGVDPGKLARQLLGALSCIHAAGVVHRDVKPSNVLIDGEGRARLTDFGIAQPEDATRITRTGEVIGTLNYMAPEVREGGPATERSDLYACGVLLGECLASDSGPEVVALVDRLSQADPAKRPRSARDALTLLDEAKPATSPTAPLTVPPPRGGRSRVVEISAPRAIAVLAALALVAVLAAVAIGGDSGGPSDNASKPAKASTTTTTTTTRVSTTTSNPLPDATPPKAGGPPKSEPKPPKDEKTPPGLAKKQGGAQKGEGK